MLGRGARPARHFEAKPSLGGGLDVADAALGLDDEHELLAAQGREPLVRTDGREGGRGALAVEGAHDEARRGAIGDSDALAAPASPPAAPRRSPAGAARGAARPSRAAAPADGAAPSPPRRAPRPPAARAAAAGRPPPRPWPVASGASAAGAGRPAAARGSCRARPCGDAAPFGGPASTMRAGMDAGAAAAARGSGRRRSAGAEISTTSSAATKTPAHRMSMPNMTPNGRREGDCARILRRMRAERSGGGRRGLGRPEGGEASLERRGGLAALGARGAVRLEGARLGGGDLAVVEAREELGGRARDGCVSFMGAFRRAAA